ncbi:F-box domain, cyclin-like protein [Tanacetum coccineum]
MGSSFSTSNGEGSGPVTGLGDLPENCLAIILANLDPPDICNLARTNKAFHRASSADFIWEPKLPENYRTLAEKLSFSEGCSEHGLVKKTFMLDCGSPVFRFSEWKCANKNEDGSACWYHGKNERLQALMIEDIGLISPLSNQDNNNNDTQSRQGKISTRFAYLNTHGGLEVEGDLEFSFPAGSYSLSFRLRLGKPSKEQNCKSSKQVHGWNIKPVRLQFSVSNGEHVTSEHFLTKQDKWLQYRVGEFVIEDSYKPTKIKFSMSQIDCTHQKGGLALDSVFICRNNKLEIGR